MRIAITGNGPLAFGIMRALIKSNHQIVGIIADGRRLRGRQRSFVLNFNRIFPLVKTTFGLATAKRIPIFFIDKMNEEELAPIRAVKPDIILVSGFSIILKRPILDLPRIGCVNVHSALLPKHRGPNPFAAVILQGDEESGVTFHKIDEGIDTGDIIAQYAFPVDRADNAMEVYRKSIITGNRHVVEVMDEIERADAIKATPQDNSVATYDQRLLQSECRLDWTKPAADIQRLVRAARPFLMPWFNCKGRRVYVTVLAMEPNGTGAEPGTVMQSKPYVKVATSRGTVTIVSAYQGKPVPWFWPSRWTRPRIGEKLE